MPRAFHEEEGDSERKRKVEAFYLKNRQTHNIYMSIHIDLALAPLISYNQYHYIANYLAQRHLYE